MPRVGALKRRPEFLRVAAGRVKWVTPGLVLQARCRGDAEEEIRVGFTVSRKVGNAVRRNRARRRLRAAAGEVLLDEKLGLHIAFGRSEHFGGQVGPERFSKPEAVVHQDHVYIEAIQPRVRLARACLANAGGEEVELIRHGAYVVRFD